MKLLLVEDSLRLQRSLRIGLERSGFRVDVAGDGKAALDWARSSSYDIIVLDLMLPKLDGLSVLRALRASENPVHVLVLSARGTPSERIEGLQAGADDYLAKPFEFDELVARARALVRRKFGCKQTVFEVGPYRFDTSRRTLTCEQREIRLTNSEFRILEYLLMRRGQAVSKQALIDHFYRGSDRGSANAIEVCVHALRKKLRDRGHGDWIRTYRGVGYGIDA